MAKASVVDGMATTAQAKAASQVGAVCCSLQSSPSCCEASSVGIGIPAIAACGLSPLAPEGPTEVHGGALAAANSWNASAEKATAPMRRMRVGDMYVKI